MILFVDLDGTVRATISGCPCPNRAEDQYILPNVQKTLKLYKEKGYKIIGVSNQSGVAKGYLTAKQAIEYATETSHLLDYIFDFFLLDKSNRATKTFILKKKCSYYLTSDPCILLVGNQFTDQKTAEDLGIEFKWAHEVFAWPNGFVAETKHGYYPEDWLRKWERFKSGKTNNR